MKSITLPLTAVNSFNIFCKINDNWVKIDDKLSVFAKNWQNYNSRRLLKPAGVQLALFWIKKESNRNFKLSTSGKFEASELKKKQISPHFWRKKSEFWKF